MDILGNLQNAWGALNAAAESQYQNATRGLNLGFDRGSQVKGPGSMNNVGAGKAVLSELINHAMDEHMMNPLAEQKAEAQRKFDANLARERHARAGGDVMHRPSVAM